MQLDFNQFMEISIELMKDADIARSDQLKTILQSLAKQHIQVMEEIQKMALLYFGSGVKRH